MIIRDNYVRQNERNLIVKGTGLINIYFPLDTNFWKYYKKQSCNLSFWYNPEKPLTEEKEVNIHFTNPPYFSPGKFTYPAHTTEPKFYSFKFNTNFYYDDMKSTNLFFIFDKQIHGGIVQIVKEIKLEIGENHTPFIPTKKDIKPEYQATFPIGGVFKDIFPQ